MSKKSVVVSKGSDLRFGLTRGRRVISQIFLAVRSAKPRNEKGFTMEECLLDLLSEVKR